MPKRYLRFWSFGLLALFFCRYGYTENVISESWSQVLLEHSIQTHSRIKPIRIRFQEDITTSDQVGSSAKSLLSVSSKSPWKAEFSSVREVLIIPNKSWISGETIGVTIRAKALPIKYRALSDYQFNVSVIEQTFEISLHGLTLNASDSRYFDFSGTLKTTDREPIQFAESVIKARLQSDSYPIKWQHSADNRIHNFSINKIPRLDRTQALTIDWDTQSIGLLDKGHREIIIPEKNDFSIASIHLYYDDLPVIKVTFSNKLAQDQNLNGLVQLNGENAPVRPDGNAFSIILPTKFQGEAKVVIAAGIKDEYGKILTNTVSKIFNIGRHKPKVKFSGAGVILPASEYLSIPFQTMNVHSVQVTAFEVFDNNIGQFLQTNTLDSHGDMERVGRYLWRKTIELPNVETDQWQTFNLDASELFKHSQGRLFRLTLSINRNNALLPCSESNLNVPVVPEEPYKNFEANNQIETSSWDYANNDYNIGQPQGSRYDPCEDAYYQWSEDAKVSKNFMASNIGLIAKADRVNRYSIVTTDIASAKPLNNTKVEFYNFQNQPIGSVITDENGFASTELDSKPFYLLAKHGNDQGVLRLENSASLPVSHFDVGGQQVSHGLKGTIFGERGVWRPGDNIYLTFVLADDAGTVPDNHPVTMRLYDPRNRLVQTQTNNTPVGSFYRFDFATDEEAITGNWEVRAQIGGASFSKKIKIETVQPNRLKVDLSFSESDEGGEGNNSKELLYADETMAGHLFSQWLHGATAQNLNAKVSVTLAAQKTVFNRGEDFTFDDPTRSYRGSKQFLVDENLDAEGHLYFKAEIPKPHNAPGMMKANFVSKVYETSGQFSIATQSAPFSPYRAYVGIKLPKGDAARGMLLTDVDHRVELLSIDADGNPLPLEKVSVSVHQISWRWWWEKGADNLGNYASTQYTQGIAHGVVETNEQGVGSWQFKIAYPTWGRFLVRACDINGGHCAAKVVYIDWPGWAGRAQESKGVGATALTLTTDKTNYQVGDVAQISLPNAQAGRALISLENGSQIISQFWRELGSNAQPIEIPITESMAPNVYLSVTMLQPHSGKSNDRPIRMYGIVPLFVENPKTRLNPLVSVPDVWGSDATAELTVSETSGKPMTYSVMVVDEGLLGLTSYRTPDLHKVFYQREALGITNWDMFDDVVGAYGGELERLLALGGGEEAADEGAEAKKKRFPPVVRVLGPFQLVANESKSHQFDMPEYLGQVRVMIVANDGDAYGSTSKQVFVREAINLLPTLPRAISPGESLVMPVAVFRNDPTIHDVELELEVVDGDINIGGDAHMSVHFDDSNEQQALFNITIGKELKDIQLKLTAMAGDALATTTVNLPVVSATTKTTQIINLKLDAGETLDINVEPHGIAGSNVASVTLSGVLPFNLQDRLNYLIRYPHGCIEQTTSAAFPQLFMKDLMPLEPEKLQSIERNVKAALERLAGFQINSGGLAYWPGQGTVSDWGTNYAGHFMVEAKDAGYSVSDELYNAWLGYQKEEANEWVASNDLSSMTSQAYRLYTLVLANEGDLAAMNRLRNNPNLNKISALILAEAYHRYGLVDVAKAIDTRLPKDFSEADDPYTYGSSVRNQAIALRSASIRGDEQQAKQLALQLGEAMATHSWYSTQTTAYALLAFSEYLAGDGFGVSAAVGVNGNTEAHVKSAKPVATIPLPSVQDENSTVRITNEKNRSLYASIAIEGLPKFGHEIAIANKLSLDLHWLDEQGNELNSVTSIPQGKSISLEVTVKNNSQQDIENLALTQVFPSGWEIENKRFENQQIAEVFDYQDIRDDRVLTYFKLEAEETHTFRLTLLATYAGVFYLPGTHVEAMYDNRYQAATVGQWVEVSR
jgi:uncharacterized protein YfaS (alpha-2-macroglobulin family)